MNNKQTIKIDFYEEVEEDVVTPSLRAYIKRAFNEAVKIFIPESNAQVSVSFVDEESIRQYNNDNRGIDSVTDVLSFPLTDYEATEVPLADELDGSLGDIVISLERAKEQAEEFGHSFEREIAFLTVHSMLHLLGYDHVNGEEEELDMRKRQSDILKNMGLEVK